MPKMRKWFRNKLTSESTENPITTRTTFLDLPGEIRNQIYAYEIYPNLSSMTIVNCTKPEHFGAAVLRHPLFRASRQIRAEAFSYLCATQTFKFLSLHTAVLFFSYVDRPSSEIKSLVLTQFVLDEGSQEIEEKFFSALETMNVLSEVTLDKFTPRAEVYERDRYAEFVRRLEKLREREVVVHVLLSKERWRSSRDGGQIPAFRA